MEQMTKQQIIANLARTQSTEEFQRMTAGWVKGNYPSYREENRQPNTKGFNLKKHKQDNG